MLIKSIICTFAILYYQCFNPSSAHYHVCTSKNLHILPVITASWCAALVLVALFQIVVVNTFLGLGRVAKG